MIVRSNLPGAALTPARLPGTLLAAAMDVEWSKNYRIRGGNVPFCYSLVWLPLPVGDPAVDLGPAKFSYRCAYVENAGQTAELVADADAALAQAGRHAEVIAGHQFCGDLAVLAAAAA